MNRLRAQIVIIAKVPVPGRAKTRLSPPFTPAEAAGLAAAALADTLAAAAGVPFARHVLALSGPVAAGHATWPEGGHTGPGRPWDRPLWPLPRCVETAGQRGDGLDERIGAALGEAYERLAVPALVIGMDTPQVTPALLRAAALPLTAGDAGAVLGPATDGGFWLLGLRRPDPALIRGVPMSRGTTGAILRDRLRQAGLRVRILPELTDVDTAADAGQVARQAPASRFAGLLHRLCTPPARAEVAGPAG